MEHLGSVGAKLQGYKHIYHAKSVPVTVEPDSSCSEKRSLLAKLVSIYGWDFSLIPLGSESVKIPCELIDEKVAGLAIPVYVYSRLTGASEEVLLGVDPGASHSGVVFAVKYTPVVWTTVPQETLIDVISKLANYFQRIIVFAGSYGARYFPDLGNIPLGKLVVKIIDEERVRRLTSGVLGDEAIKRLDDHMRDAHRIFALGVAETLRERLSPSR